MLIITLSYDNEKKTGNWVPMDSSGAPQVNLLDVAEAFAWAEWDALMKLAKAQVEIKKEE